MTMNNFKVNIKNVLNLEFASFITDLKSLSLTDAKSYFMIRKAVSKELIDQILEDVYESVYEAITNGDSKGGKPLLAGKFGSGSSLIPRYNNAKASIFASDLCVQLEVHLRTIVDLLFPLSFNVIADNALNMNSKSQLSIQNQATVVPVNPTA